MSDHIHDFWEDQALRHKDSPTASWGDESMIALEVEAIAEHLPAHGRVLDVGCANGHATQRIAAKKSNATFSGVDFSAAMITQASARTDRAEIAVAYSVADARELPFEDGAFDAAYTTRTLINIPTWEGQRQAIEELLRVVKPGGRVILSEAFWEPLMKVNAVRLIAGLGPLVEHDFNRYLKQTQLQDFLEQRQLAYSVDPFSSIYYLGTRIVRELATDFANFPGYSNPINVLFHEMEQQWSGGPFSVQTLYAINT